VNADNGQNRNVSVLTLMDRCQVFRISPVRISLLVGLMLAAASAAAAAPISVTRDGVEIIITPAVSAGGGPDTVVQVQLDVEARSDDAAHRLGFRSMRGQTQIDCRSGANRFVSAEAYDQPGLMGEGAARPVSGAWVTPAADSNMLEVTQRVCAGVLATAASAPPTVVTSAGDSNASAPPPRSTKSAAAGRLPRVSTPGSATTASSAPPPPPPPRVSTRLTPAGPTAMTSTSKPGNWVAQVAASPTQQAAQHELDRLRSMIAPPLATSVEAAVVNNAHLFRASVTGFGTPGEAKAFCARAASVSKTCWAHSKSLAAAPAGKSAGAR
jgi:hypothetical protein